MERFVDYVMQFGNLNKHQINLIQSKATEVNLRKAEYFAEAGQPFKRIGFVVEGVFRICYYNNKEEDITRYFIEENHLIFNPHHPDEPFTEYIQAATECRVITSANHDWKEIPDSSVGWDASLQKTIQKGLPQSSPRRGPLVEPDGKSRYLNFM